MSDQPLDESAEEVDHHPPFRMRSRGRLLLPDIAPPTRAELRWAAEQRRINRAARDARRSAERARRSAERARRSAERADREAPQVAERQARAQAVATVADPVPIEVPVDVEPIAIAAPVEAPAAPADDDWLIFPEVAGRAVTVERELEPDPEPEPEAAPEVEDAGSAEDPVEDVESQEWVRGPAAAFKPLALDPIDEDRPPTFARLRSPRVAVRRPEWLDRGPLFDDAEDIELPDLEPSLDLDFHDRESQPDSEPEPAYEPEHDDYRADVAFERAVVELAPWRPVDEPEVDEPEVDEPEVDRPDERLTDESDEGELPVVSHLLVVRDPLGDGPPRIGVLDEAADEHLPELDDYFVGDHAAALDDEFDGDAEGDVDDELDAAWGALELPVRTARAAMPATLAPDIEHRYVPAPAVPKVWDGRPAPMFWRVLRLRHIRPNGWLRALFFEGSVALAVVLVLAGAASVWTIVVLPLVVALIVKANDVLVGSLRRSFNVQEEPEEVAQVRAEQLV
jgi:hypothetical protein